MLKGAQIFFVLFCLASIYYITSIGQKKTHIVRKFHSFGVPVKADGESRGRRNQGSEKDEKGPQYEFLKIFNDNCDEDTIQCVNLTAVNTPICVHQNDYVSGYLINTGGWEPRQVNIFMQLLLKYPNTGFIDIGANLGVYSIVAAKMNRQVLAVEPWFGNLCRVRKSLMLGNLQRHATLLLNAISVKRGTAVMSSKPGNRGGQQINLVDTYKDENNKYYVKTILLEDVLMVTNFKSAIVKFDIEGHEWLLMESIGSFIDKANVVAFVFETHNLTPLYTQSCPKLYELMSSKGYQAYSNPITNDTIKEPLCGNYVGHIFWLKQ